MISHNHQSPLHAAVSCNVKAIRRLSQQNFVFKQTRKMQWLKSCLTKKHPYAMKMLNHFTAPEKSLSAYMSLVAGVHQNYKPHNTP